MKRSVIIFLLAVWMVQVVRAQQFHQMRMPDYANDSICFTPKNTGLAVSEVLGTNMLIWAFGRYISKADYAYISFNTIKMNLIKGFVWDTDGLSTNLLDHPYQGALYFNAARSNGFGFWQSVPFVAGGSLMWEGFMENEYPSLNDLLSTTAGGVGLGEICFRLSDLLLDDRSSGSERIGREVLSAFISPIRGFNRLITGEAWKKKSTDGRSFHMVPVDMAVGLGPRFFTAKNSSASNGHAMQLAISVNYGDPFGKDSYLPYEWFDCRVGLDFLTDQPMVNYMNTVGILWGKTILCKNSMALTTGIYQHFDFYDSESSKRKGIAEIDPYRISEAVAFGGGLQFVHAKSRNNKLDLYFNIYLNGILLGATSSDYFLVGNRDYNFGSGYSLKANTLLNFGRQWSFIANIENYNIFTWKGYDPTVDLNKVDPRTFNFQGDNSQASWSVLTTEWSFNSSNKWFLSFRWRYFIRSTNYKYYPKVKSTVNDLMLSLGLRI